MIFNSPTVQKYLLSGARFVATIRKKSRYYYIGKWITIRAGDKQFGGKIVSIEPVAPPTLRYYVAYSGFKSVGEWTTEAERLHKTKIDPNKFEIVVVEVVHEWSPIHNGVCKKLRVESSDNKIEIRRIEEGE